MCVAFWKKEKEKRLMYFYLYYVEKVKTNTSDIFETPVFDKMPWKAS